MAKRILVPLSGRDRDEGIVPLVAALAREWGATVRLLRVFPMPEVVVGPNGRVVAYLDQQMARLSGEGTAHLQTVESRLDGVPVESVVRFGDTVREILVESEAFGAELIALRASSRNWMTRLFAPSAADRVARKAQVPTLLLRQRHSPDTLGLIGTPLARPTSLWASKRSRRSA
jgi:nucleotide-binding universal stress UspA family protein